MTQYTNYCTEEQTRRAYKLGAPLEIFDPDNSNGVLIGDKAFAIPTTQQMRGWLRDFYIHIVIEYQTDCSNDADGNIVDRWNYYRFFVCINDNCIYGEMTNEMFDTYNQAELAAIDAALDYLEKGE